jgi:hypothetical protein
MSQEQEFNFDKFVVDIEKRQNENVDQRRISQIIADEDMRRRRRNELYNERWQNQVKWEQQ